jgi:hypothetical protein
VSQGQTNFPVPQPHGNPGPWTDPKNFLGAVAFIGMLFNAWQQYQATGKVDQATQTAIVKQVQTEIKPDLDAAKKAVDVAKPPVIPAPPTDPRVDALLQTIQRLSDKIDALQPKKGAQAPIPPPVQLAKVVFYRIPPRNIEGVASSYEDKPGWADPMFPQGTTPRIKVLSPSGRNWRWLPANASDAAILSQVAYVEND